MGHASAALPVVDLASTDISAATKSIRQALVDYGFFYVINHGIDDALMKSVYAESNNFFQQPMEEKMALRKNSSHRGYIPPDFEGFEADASGKGDLLECFHIGSGVDGESKNDVNQWPPAERFPSWKKTMKSYYECAMGTSKRILSLIALSLDLDAEFFKPHDSETILRPIHYSGRAIESKHGSDHGANAHTDYGMLTLLSTDGTPGLQICRDKDGRPQLWEDVHHIDGALVVNIGDLLERWTNNVYRSTLHRVLMVGKERYSVSILTNC
ncbi:2-oxoglutarate-Fe(II) type oxidoreductase hxnY-like [Triticum aestivum]|uniref:2-oxoglutarate-Fe(II) type oxidoreductase hxnY-like n=1 Tax=Triticum aestivum TaxID=4565 RepID=UPI001D02E9B5|nr:2-oxoglutarate-Fe(II) type oxidoreductase hxnY-like [Triticum aestivum]